MNDSNTHVSSVTSDVVDTNQLQTSSQPQGAERKSTPEGSSLLSLPNEILTDILEYVAMDGKVAHPSGPEDIYNASLTCHTFLNAARHPENGRMFLRSIKAAHRLVEEAQTPTYMETHPERVKYILVNHFNTLKPLMSLVHSGHFDCTRLTHVYIHHDMGCEPVPEEPNYILDWHDWSGDNFRPANQWIVDWAYSRWLKSIDKPQVDLTFSFKGCKVSSTTVKDNESPIKEKFMRTYSWGGLEYHQEHLCLIDEKMSVYGISTPDATSSRQAAICVEQSSSSGSSSTSAVSEAQN